MLMEPRRGKLLCCDFDARSEGLKQFFLSILLWLFFIAIFFFVVEPSLSYCNRFGVVKAFLKEMGDMKCLRND